MFANAAWASSFPHWNSQYSEEKKIILMLHVSINLKNPSM